MLEGICATVYLRIQVLKLSQILAGYPFEGCYFGTIMANAKIGKIKCLSI